MRSRNTILCITCLAALLCGSSTAFTQELGCGALPTFAQLQAALKTATGTPPSGNGGFNLQMWATVVNRDGVVCGVVFTGQGRGDQWPGSRVISAQKANTANAFSLPGSHSPRQIYSLRSNLEGAFSACSTAILFTLTTLTQAPLLVTERTSILWSTRRLVESTCSAAGWPCTTRRDNWWEGLGVSGDSSCADHNVAWKTRHALGLNHVPGGISATGDDNIVYPDHSNSPQEERTIQCLGTPGVFRSRHRGWQCVADIASDSVRPLLGETCGAPLCLSCEMTHRFIPALSAHRGTAVPRARSTQAERSLRTGLPLRSQNAQRWRAVCPTVREIDQDQAS
jgi:hypothetical protein